MEYQKDFNNFKEFVRLFDQSLDNNNIQQIKTFYPLIESFENLFLSGYQKRRKEGTFYTDKKVSEFMVLESLLCLINKKSNLCDRNFKEIELIENIYDFDPDYKQKIIEFLLNCKICDPACGSGRFVLSSVQILFSIIKNLNPNLSDFKIKNQILRNLFGYDINEDAIKLCQLKLVRWYDPKQNENIKKILNILTKNIQIRDSIINSNVPQFDIVIGNPPYGNIINLKDKKILKKEQIFSKDIYCTFLLKALEWSTEIICFLIPKSFLLRQGYIRFRRDILSKANFLKIFDMGSKMFKNATNEVQILVYENKNGYKNRDLVIYDFPKREIIRYPNQKFDSLKICFNPNCPLTFRFKKNYTYTFLKKCPFCKSVTIDLQRIRIKPSLEIYHLIEKIERIGDLNYLNPVDFPKMIRGEEEIGLKLVKRKLQNNRKGSCFFISARNDFSYYNLKKNKSFYIEEINPQSLKGKDYEYYKGKKLLIKHNNIIPEAVFTDDTICFTSSVYSLLHDNIDELKYLCASINCILTQFYCIYAINNQKDTTINLNQYMIRHLPIMKSDNKTKITISKKVDLVHQILHDNKGIINGTVAQTLKQIDDIILNLFSITEIEKKLIISNIKNLFMHFKIIYDT